jgi:hypothetical protein
VNEDPKVDRQKLAKITRVSATVVTNSRGQRSGLEYFIMREK